MKYLVVCTEAVGAEMDGVVPELIILGQCNTLETANEIALNDIHSIIGDNEDDWNLTVFPAPTKDCGKYTLGYLESLTEYVSIGRYYAIDLSEV